MTGRWLIIVLIVAIGWGMLELMLRQLKIGEYAESPQYFEMPEGLTVLAGGGIAGIQFVEAPFLRSARFIVRCKDTEQKLQLKPKQESDEICGVRILFQRFVPGGKVSIRVRWGDPPEEAAQPKTEPREASTDPTTNPTVSPGQSSPAPNGDP